MQNLRLMTALTAMVMTATALSACGGNECASGTTEKDGQCVPTTTLTCGDGTTLENGACVPTSTTTCGAGSILENGVCVATSECGDGTMLVNGKCEPTSTITCGAGTMESNGACVPTSTLACGPGTMESGGNCVIAALACGTGAQLDANAGTCVVTDAVCGTGTAFTNGSCLPTDAVCAMGTTFNEATGTCLSDATCQVGDVVLGGICVRPVDQLISEATVMETENNDPALGGTAQALTLPAAGTKLVVAGAIGAPTDLDADTIADQDSDAYTITLAAGELIQLSVQPAAGPSLGFVVFGPDGSNYTRSSTLGLTPGAARQIFAPVAGDYTVVVEPAVTLAGNAGPIGNATWTYALTAEMLAAPTAADVDVTMASPAGQLADLHDNLLRLTGAAAGSLVNVKTTTLGSNVQGARLYIGGSLDAMGREVTLNAATNTVVSVPAGDLLTFFDWTQVNGPDTAFEVSVTPITNQQALGALSATSADSTPVSIPAGDTYYYTFSAQAGQVLRLKQNNDESSSLRISVTGAGAVAGLNSVLPMTLSNTDVGDDPNYTFALLPAAGDYIIAVENTLATARTNVVLSTLVKTPQELGTKASGDTVTATTGAVALNDREYARVTFTESVKVTGTVVAGSGDPDFRFYNATTGAQLFISNGGSSTETIAERTVAPGTYLTEILAYEDLPDTALSLTLTQGPLDEIEPNNDAATATAIPTAREIAGSVSASDADVFSFTLATAQAAGEAVSLYVRPSSALGVDPTFTCEIKDAAGATVSTSTSPNDCLVYGTGLAAGTYTLHLSTTSANAVNYIITAGAATGVIALDAEPNNTSATAVMLPSTTGLILGSVTPAATPEKDYYAFTLAAAIPVGDQLNFALAPDSARQNTGTLTIKLEDAAGATVITGSNNLISTTTLAAGTYYLVVSRTSTSLDYTGRYKISASLAPIPTAEFEDVGPADIDATTPTVTRPLVVNKPGCVIASTKVFVDVSHTFPNDLDITLTAPDGTEITLQNYSFLDNGPDLIGTYPDTLTPDESLNGLNGKDPNGTWTITFDDTYPSFDNGVFNSWGLYFTCAP